jgi:hypothetical protein
MILWVSAPESHDLSSFLEFGLDFSALDGSVHDGQCLEDNEVMHPRLIVFAFGVEQRDFGQEYIRPPRDWAAHDIKGDMPPDDRSSLFGAGDYPPTLDPSKVCDFV